MRITLVYVVVASLAVGHVAASMEGPQRIRLPDAEYRGEVSLEETIRKRRSVRDYRRSSLTLNEVSQMLWAAQGITGRSGFRSTPSAGALYPLELYVVAGNVDGLSPGVYQYRSRMHDLVEIASGDQRRALATAALGQSWVRRAPAVLVLTGVYERTLRKYGERGRRYVHMEVGHTAQNVYLQATALGLGTVMVGAFDDNDVKEVLGLPADHEPLGLMPIGHK